MARMAGSTLRAVASWGLIGALGVVIAAQPLGCGPGESDEALDDTVGAMLASVGPDVVVPALDTAHADALALQSAVDAWAAASGEDVATSKAAAQDAWRTAMASWQRVELYQLGPLADDDGTTPGAADGRARVYSWPPANACRVDQETVRGEFADDGWSERVLVNVKGLDALERLLFAGPDHACASRIGIDEDWEALGTDGVDAARADYAAVLAAGVAADIDGQRTSWASFGEELASAGVDSTVYDRQDEALNAVFDALFYIETGTKDTKLAKPMGLRDCGTELCLEDVEHPLSGESLTAIRANLDGFEVLFTGGDGVGLDEVLESRGHGDIVQAVQTGLDNARAAADALDAPIDEGLEQSPEQVAALHAAVKEVADAMKGDIATVLSLRIPTEAAGDSD